VNEKLIIRVGEGTESPIHWLIWSESNKETIASGELASSLELESLSEHAKKRKVILLLPSAKVQLKQVNLPAKWSRKLAAALPYMIEEDVACDIDELFIAHGQASTIDGKSTINVARVEREWFSNWRAIMKQTGLSISHALPDALLLPTPTEGEVSAIELGDTWLFKTSAWQIAQVENQWQSAFLRTLGEVKVNHYSPCDFTSIETSEQLAEYDLPLALFAKHLAETQFNLLQGEFQVKQEVNKNWLVWKSTAIAASVALFATLSLKGVELYQLKQEAAQTKAMVETSYRKAFPNTKTFRVNTIRSSLQSQLNKLNQGGNVGFLSLLDTIVPVLSEVDGFSPESLRYEAKRGEIRLRAAAKDFQSFNQLKGKLEQLDLTVEQGALNNVDSFVVGEIKVKGQ
jgi:general secretion pathway protein L